MGVFAIRLSHVLMLIAGASLLVAAPAFAQSAVTIPEPTDLALFGLGIAGLLIGRRGARHRRKDDKGDQ